MRRDDFVFARIYVVERVGACVVSSCRGTFGTLCALYVEFERHAFWPFFFSGAYYLYMNVHYQAFSVKCMMGYLSVKRKTSKLEIDLVSTLKVIAYRYRNSAGFYYTRRKLNNSSNMKATLRITNSYSLLHHS